MIRTITFTITLSFALVAFSSPAFAKKAARKTGGPVTKAENVLARLPTQGQSNQIPWSGWWWPTNNGGINSRWISPNEPSPVEKYDMAFSGGRLSATDWVRQNSSSNKDRTLTGLLGFSWYGECDAYSIAASVEPEPRFPILENGVCFTSGDIKALITHTYRGNMWGLGTKSREGLTPELNPTFFHLMLTHVLGMGRDPMVMDFGSNTSVFNHPVFRYSSQYEVVPLWDYTQRTGYRPEPGTASIVRVTTDLDYIDYQKPTIQATGRADMKRTRLAYYLFLDESGRITGKGVWAPGFSKRPDIIAEVSRVPKKSPSQNPYMSYALVRRLVERSNRATAPECGVSGR